MWPWGHLAFGYLFYFAWTRVRYRRSSDPLAFVALAIGTQLPDVIDKPLAYWWAILPEGRSLAHSYVFAIPLCVIVLVLAWHYGVPKTGSAFAIGYASHPIADGLPAILNRDPSRLTYLAYPLVPPPDYEADSFAYHLADLRTYLEDIVAHGAAVDTSSFFAIELSLTLAMVVLWVYDGAPPLPAGWRAVKARL